MTLICPTSLFCLVDSPKIKDGSSLFHLSIQIMQDSKSVRNVNKRLKWVKGFWAELFAEAKWTYRQMFKQIFKKFAIVLRRSLLVTQFQETIPKNHPKSKVILTKSTFWKMPEYHAFWIFLEMSCWDVGFTDSDMVTSYLRDIALHYSLIILNIWLLHYHTWCTHHNRYNIGINHTCKHKSLLKAENCKQSAYIRIFKDYIESNVQAYYKTNSLPRINLVLYF